MKKPPLLTRVDLEIRAVINWEKVNGKKWPHGMEPSIVLSHACVNYLKHEWWSYDKTIKARKMTDSEYLAWFKKITTEIKKEYPFLKNAVKQQVRVKNNAISDTSRQDQRRLASKPNHTRRIELSNNEAMLGLHGESQSN